VRVCVTVKNTTVCCHTSGLDFRYFLFKTLLHHVNIPGMRLFDQKSTVIVPSAMGGNLRHTHIVTAYRRMWTDDFEVFIRLTLRPDNNSVYHCATLRSTTYWNGICDRSVCVHWSCSKKTLLLCTFHIPFCSNTSSDEVFISG